MQSDRSNRSWQAVQQDDDQSAWETVRQISSSLRKKSITARPDGRRGGAKRPKTQHAVGETMKENMHESAKDHIHTTQTGVNADAPEFSPVMEDAHSKQKRSSHIFRHGETWITNQCVEEYFEHGEF